MVPRLITRLDVRWQNGKSLLRNSPVDDSSNVIPAITDASILYDAADRAWRLSSFAVTRLQRGGGRGAGVRRRETYAQLGQTGQVSMAKLSVVSRRWWERRPAHTGVLLNLEYTGLNRSRSEFPATVLSSLLLSCICMLSSRVLTSNTSVPWYHTPPGKNGLSSLRSSILRPVWDTYKLRFYQTVSRGLRTDRRKRYMRRERTSPRVYISPAPFPPFCKRGRDTTCAFVGRGATRRRPALRNRQG